MKNYFIRAIVSAVAYTIVYLLRDLIFGKVHSFFEYVVQAVIFGILFGLFSYLDDKGWNSWKKVADLFKRKKTDVINNRECIAALPVVFPGGNKQVRPAGLIRGPLDDDEVVLSGNESQTTPRSVDLIHAVNEFHNPYPAYVGVVVGIVQFGGKRFCAFWKKVYRNYFAK